MLRIDGLDEVKATARLFADADKPTQAAIRKQSQAWAPTLRAAALSRAHDPVSRAVAASGKVTVTGKGLRAVFGGSGSFHGEPLRNLAGPFEFGGNRQRKETYLSRSKGRAVRVTRKTQVQIPPKTPAGRFLYPAVADTTPDLVGRWVRAVVQAVTDG